MNAFDTPRTKALRELIKREGPQGTGRIVGLSIEDDGVFIYTDSHVWCDDAGAGTFREDSEGAALRDFVGGVQQADGNRAYPQPLRAGVDVRFTPFQAEELAHRIDVMRDGFEQDPEDCVASSYGFESDDALATFAAKIRAARFGVEVRLTPAEVEAAEGEFDNLAEIAASNAEFFSEDASGEHAKAARKLRDAVARIVAAKGR